MKQMGKRIAALAVMLCVSLGPVAAYTKAYAVEYREDTSNSPVVMTINGSEVKADEFATYMLYMMTYYEQQMYYSTGMTDIWNNEQMAEMMGAGMPDMARNQAVFVRVVMQKFNEAGLELDGAALKRLSDERRKTMKELGGKQAYLDRIAMIGFSDQLYNNYMVVNECYKALNEHYFGENGAAMPSEEELMQHFRDNYLSAKHILIQTNDGMGTEVRTDEEAKAEAQKVLDRLNNGEDFDTVMNEVSEDPGLAGNPEGYTFAEAGMDPAFYEAAKGLAEGETSGLVKGQFGYHIIQRTPTDYEGQLDNYRTTLAMEMGKTMDDLMGQWVAEADVQTTEDYDKVTYKTVYDYAPVDKPVDENADAAQDEAQDTAADAAAGEGAE